MEEIFKKNGMLSGSHLIILIGNTVMSSLLVFESLRNSWETWAVVLIAIMGIMCWVMHIIQFGTDNERTWIYAICMMITFFYYGVHPTSTFDMSVVMGAIIMLFTMAGISALVLMAQVVYYLTFIYNVVAYYVNGGTFDPLMISRICLHVTVMTLIAWFARVIVRKWKRMLDDIGERVNDISETTERLDDFLANASHEIRTPVNAVIGLTSVCVDRGINEANKDDVDAIRNAGRRVASQMSDILDYSEIDRNLLVTNKENYMISSLLFDLVSELKPYIIPEVELIFDVDPAIPSIMYSDLGKIKKILWHLIMNGMKYTNAGGVYVRLTSEEGQLDSEVSLCIDVSDTGIGMTQEEIEQIYDRFYQVDSSRSRVKGGLGLGMHIVSGFVRILGGFVTIKSEIGKGTTVHVCLPQKVIDPSGCVSVRNPEKVVLGAFFSFKKYPIPAVREYYNSMITNIVKGMGVGIHGVDSAENLKKVVDTTGVTHIFVGMKEYESASEYIESIAEKIPVFITADPGYQLPAGSKVRFFEKPLYCFPVISAINATMEGGVSDNVRIMLDGVRALVVDDEPMNLIVAKSIFSGYGMVIDTAESGPESIDMCSKNEYNIVFMDHMMPGMDGVEAMKRIKSLSKGRSEMAIVALTANTVSAARDMFMKEGFDGFVGKPIDAMELERTLKNVLPKKFIRYVEEDDVKPVQNIKKTESVRGKHMENNDNESKSNDFVSLKAFGLDASIGLGYCDDDSELFTEILRDYAANAPDNRAFLDDMLAAENMEEYEIKIHSVKSTSRMIGALELGDISERLELAAHEGRINDVRNEHGDAMTMYTGLTEAIDATL